MNTGIFRLFLSLLLIIAFTFSPTLEALGVAMTPQTTRISGQTAPKNTLLQFTAGGHILGFKPDRVYYASLDHAIIEEFVGTKGVMPAGEAGKGKTEGIKGAPPLGKVIYKNLWEGITLKYEAKDGGIAESAFMLEPYADVKKIKLRYNVSVGIEKDGSLRFRHPSERGYFSQSTPKAWQDIKGKRIPVEVAFADYGKNTIGYRLSAYNRQYPVIIDPTYQWHTFYGSAADDYGNGIATDTSSNVYVSAGSNATWNGLSGQAPLHAYSGGDDIVVLKLSDVTQSDNCNAALSSDFKLHIPELNFGGSYYVVDMEYVPTSDGLIWFKLTNAASTQNTCSSTATLTASTGTYTLQVPYLTYGATSYWADFEYVPTTDGFVWFKLTNAGQN